MILTAQEAAACLHTATEIPGFVEIYAGPRHVTFWGSGSVTVQDAETGDTERFSDRANFADRYGVAA